MRKRTHLLAHVRVCRFLLVQAAAAAAASYAATAVGLRLLLIAADNVSRCRCWFSYLLLLWSMAAFVARLREMVVFLRRVFGVLHLGLALKVGWLCFH